MSTSPNRRPRVLGRVLVHNPFSPDDYGRFRWWTESYRRKRNLEPCECEWGQERDAIAPKKGTHFCSDEPPNANRSPRGHVLVHNQFSPDDHERFRWWTQNYDRSLVICLCEWGEEQRSIIPEIGYHFRYDQQERRIQRVLDRVLEDIEDDALLGALTDDPRLLRVAEVVREVRDQPGEAHLEPL